jgi:CheY-like chemotaxis protein
LRGTAVPDQSRVLIVDDNADAADCLSLLLGLHRFNVQVAYNGASALSAALAAPPDAMLVDLGMPLMDGFRLAELVRCEESLRETLLVAVTGYGGGQVQEAVRVAGFDHYLLKPVEINQLLNVLPSARSLLRMYTEEQRNLTDEIKEMARRQSEITAAAKHYLRKNRRLP